MAFHQLRHSAKRVSVEADAGHHQEVSPSSFTEVETAHLAVDESSQGAFRGPRHADLDGEHVARAAANHGQRAACSGQTVGDLIHSAVTPASEHDACGGDGTVNE